MTILGVPIAIHQRLHVSLPAIGLIIIGAAAAGSRGFCLRGFASGESHES